MGSTSKWRAGQVRAGEENREGREKERGGRGKEEGKGGGAAYATAIPSVCPSVRTSVIRADQSKTVEVRIMQFSSHSSLISLVFAR